MKVLRAKNVRKTLKFFKLVFGINAPYHVLLDGNFIYTALKYKLDIRHRLESLLQEENIRVYVLQSVLDELEQVGEKAAVALEWAKRCCEVYDDSKIKAETIPERMGKVIEQAANGGKNAKSKKRFFIASQDKDLRHSVGRIAGVPTLYFNKVTLVLEPPSQASREYSSQLEQTKSQLSEIEQVVVEKVGKNQSTASIVGLPNGETPQETATASTNGPRLKRKAQAPNPLSCKEASEDSHNSKKRKLSKYRSK